MPRNDPQPTEWKGGLIYPVDHEAGKRYPFILQTHGYSEKEFVIDGPGGVTTAFAAQPLANAGFVVLQAAESPAAITADDREGRYVAEGWRAVIEKLDAQGLIDPAKVGVIGWSRTGYHVAAMLAEFPDSVAAATISDSAQYSYSQYLLAGESKLYTVESEKMTGGAPARVGYGEWFARNPIYRMSKSNTALRVEAITIGSLVSMWETYAVHAQAGKPADLVYFPEGSHVLLKPSERRGSQGGNVDWFRFWLQSYEDPDLDKVERYARWRRLKADQLARGRDVQNQQRH